MGDEAVLLRQFTGGSKRKEPKRSGGTCKVMDLCRNVNYCIISEMNTTHPSKSLQQRADMNIGTLMLLLKCSSFIHCETE